MEYYEIATLLLYYHISFFSIAILVSLCDKPLTFFGTMKRVFKFIFSIIKETLRAIFLRQIKTPSHTQNFDLIYTNQLKFIGFGNKKTGKLINISLIILMVIFYLLDIITLLNFLN